MAKQHKAAGASSPTREPLDDEIRSLAYQLYCEGGYQDGHDLEHWVQAEQRILDGKTANLRRVA
jgi:hypothetical protein